MPVPVRELTPPKAQYVARMFSAIAHRYDLMNRLMSGWQDQRWRRLAVQELGAPPGGLVLDVGTGTGDFLPLLVEAGYRVVGVDFTYAMMARAREKLAGRIGRATLVAGDALALPFPDEVFDGLVNGFLLRNLADLPQGLAEMQRVVKPGAPVVCLEITSPTMPVFREAFSLYFGHLVPVIGGLISGRPDAYAYLPESVRGFVNPDQLQALMEAAGLRQVRYRRLALGTVTIHVGIR